LHRRVTKEKLNLLEFPSSIMTETARHERRGVPHPKVSGKGEKTRYVPLHGVAGDLIAEYLTKAGHGKDHAVALFRPLRNSRGEWSGQSR